MTRIATDVMMQSSPFNAIKAMEKRSGKICGSDDTLEELRRDPFRYPNNVRTEDIEDAIRMLEISMQDYLQDQGLEIDYCLEDTPGIEDTYTQQ